jgi:hypothetical protein
MDLTTQLTVGELKYEWIENWAKLPDSSGHAHHGLAIDRQGHIVTADNTEPKILILDKEGNLLNSFETPVIENHGLCLAEENGAEVLYIADVAGKYGIKTKDPLGKVIKCDMLGNLLAEIKKNDLPGLEQEKYFSPTTTAFDRTTGDLWITDGYGSGKIFKLNKDLEYQLTLDGTEGAGRFNCPHGIFIDHRQPASRLYVADRANDRVQVYNTDGSFIKTFGQGVLSTPSVFSSFENYLVIGELKARLVLLDQDDQVIGFLGAGPGNVDKPGWPNRLDGNGQTVPPQDLKPGQFNSPHGLAADTLGNIYISEWLLHDRYIKLKRLA